MNAVILAAGKASRLGLTNIQKCMLSFGNKLAIDLLIDRLPKVDEICFCIGDDFRAELLKNYLVSTYKLTNLRFVVQKEALGTANGVLLCLKDSGYTDTIISWSDIIPKEKLPTPEESTIFTSDNAVMQFVSRYRVDGSGIRPTKGEIGNIMGLFYVKDVNTLLPVLETNQSCDFVDVLQISGQVFERHDIDFYDFGTEESLELTNHDLSTSSHAALTVSGSRVVKEYSEDDRNLFEMESAWYRCATKEVKPFIPKIYEISDLRIEMEFLRADGFNDIKNERLAKDFLAKVVYVLDEYFHVLKFPSNVEHIREEYINKPLRRSEYMFDVVPGLSNQVITINGEEYQNPVLLLKDERISNNICNQLCPALFRSIHGDPTLQNIMQSGGDVWLIDPKARFGDVWLFGDPKQDFAKIYYSLVGNYDGLNVGNYTLKTGETFEYSIPHHRFGVLGDWYLNYLESKLDIDPMHIKLIHALLWIRTVGYDWTKSVEQSIVSFLNGTVLLNNILSEI